MNYLEWQHRITVIPNFYYYCDHRTEQKNTHSTAARAKTALMPPNQFTLSFESAPTAMRPALPHTDPAQPHRALTGRVTEMAHQFPSPIRHFAVIVIIAHTDAHKVVSHCRSALALLCTLWRLLRFPQSLNGVSLASTTSRQFSFVKSLFEFASFASRSRRRRSLSTPPTHTSLTHQQSTPQTHTPTPSRQHTTRSIFSHPRNKKTCATCVFRDQHTEHHTHV